MTHPYLVPAACGIVLSALGLLASACTDSGDAPKARPAPRVEAAAQPAAGEANEPCAPPTTRPAEREIERFAAGSPFDKEYKPPVVAGGKRIWADSWQWMDVPKLHVEKWLSAEPNTTGKFVLIEFWATWCPPCRKSIALLNKLHEKFGKDLIVIAISDESEADVRAIGRKYGIEIQCFSAIDTKARTKDKLGVFGVPHAIIAEPGGVIIWEGFPLLPGHELTESMVGKIIEIGRKSGSLK